VSRIFGPKGEENGSWRKLNNDALHSPYSSLNIVRVIKPWRIRWAGHVACMGDERGVYRVFVGRPEVRNHWEDIDVGGRITLRLTLGRWGSMEQTGFSWLRIESCGKLLWAQL
jgi:hypothetical protein